MGFPFGFKTYGYEELLLVEYLDDILGQIGILVILGIAQP